MESAGELTANDEDYVFAKDGEIYAIYMPRAVATSIDLGEHKQDYRVDWYNPRLGGDLQQGSVARVQGPGMAGTGRPPGDEDLDWVVLIRSQ